MKTNPNVPLFEASINVNNTLVFINDASKFSLSNINNYNGFFRFIFVKDDIIYFGVDHAAVYKLFYKLDGDKINIYKKISLNNKLDDINLSVFLTSGYTLGNSTIYKNIKQCSPGVLYLYNLKTSTLTKKKWFEPCLNLNGNPNFEELKNIFKNLVPKTSLPVNLALTAGLDSRLILSKLLKNNANVSCFTFGNDIDKNIASKVCKNINYKAINFNIELGKKYFKTDILKKLINTSFNGMCLPHDLHFFCASYFKSGSVFMPGHSGDWVTGSYQLSFSKFKNVNDIVKYFYKNDFNLTLLTNFELKKIIKQKIKNIIDVSKNSLLKNAYLFEYNHRQSKYNLNSNQTYNAFNQKVYYPLYTKKFINYFFSLKPCYLQNQSLYFEAIKKIAFCDDLLYLKQIPTSNAFFNSGKLTNKFSVKQKIASIVNMLDAYNYRKKMLKPNLKWQMMAGVYSTNPLKFYKQKIKNVFNLNDCISKLKFDNCNLAAKHLNSIKNKTVGQISFNGLFLLKLLPYIIIPNHE